jgi:hypothetical protein
VCMCVCVYEFLFMCLCVHMRVCVCVCVCVCMCLHLCVFASVSLLILRGMKCLLHQSHATGATLCATFHTFFHFFSECNGVISSGREPCRYPR